MQKDKKGSKTLNKKQKMIAIITLIVVIVALIVAVALVLVKKDLVQLQPSAKVNKNFTFLLDKESTAIQNDNIFSGQVAINNDYTKIYNDGNYTIDNPYVVVNPFVISPQTALIMFKTKDNEEITLTIKGKHNDDLVTKFESSKDHFIPVYGLYGDYENEVTIETSSGDRNTLKINITDKIDSGEVEVLKNDVLNTNGEFYFATSSLGVGSMAYDNYGEVRWWLNIGYSKGMTMLKNGHILLSSANEGPDITSTSGVVEVDMLGYVYREYEIEGGYHHDAYEQADGNLLILTSKVNSESFADRVILLNRETGKIDKHWDLRDIVLSVDPNFLEEGDFTWGWINSIYYDKESNSLILSLRNQNSVVAIDYETGNIKWILGDSQYWSAAFSEYLIKGVGDDFIYPAGQHSVYMTEDGYLSIFNNGYNANHEQAVSCASIKDNASYAMLYKIDYDKKEASVVWRYGGNEYFSYALSSFTYALNNHRIFNSGWHFTEDVDFANPECTQFSNDLYDSYLIDFDENNNIVVKLHIDEAKFEVVKAPIYNLAAVSVEPQTIDINKNYIPEKGEYLTTYPSEEFETLTESEALKYKANEDCYISFVVYNNRFKLFGAIPDEMDFRVTFISTSGKAYRYTMKKAGEKIKDFINLSGMPSGRYYVYVNMNDYVYNTTEYIDIP